MTKTMSHHKLLSSSSLTGKASVLTLVVMVAGVLFATQSSAMAQEGAITPPLANETGGGEGTPIILPPTNGTGETVFPTNETGAITPPLANETGGGEGTPIILPPTNGTGETVFPTNETGAITPPLANETGAITPPLANETGAITPPPTVGVAAPLTAQITANPIEGDVPLTVELSAVVAGGTAAYTYNWDFGDGTAIPRSEMATVQHIFENAGIYTVAVTVTDTSGQVVTANLEITVNEPPPPAEEPPAEEPPAEEPPAEEPPAEEPPAE
jgi:PKD repeat protein